MSEVKKKLQDITDFKVMSFKEAVLALGWELIEEDESFSCECNCGNSKMDYRGFIGTEVVECESCGKRITDLFSPIQTGNATCTVLRPKEFDVERDDEGYFKHWVADDDKGGIKYEK